jgi:uroporphyrinogen-III synthase
MSDEVKSDAASASIVTFASPSAARFWASQFGINYTAVCIGPTTHQETLLLGFSKTYFCNVSEGLYKFVELIKDVVNGGYADSKC